MNNNANIIKVAMADDHGLVRAGLEALVRDFGDCEIIFSVSNGLEVMEKINQKLIPDLLLLDLSMPQMDGYDTACWLHLNYPKMRVLMVSAYDSEPVLIRMLKAGVHGFLNKDVPSEVLHLAINTIMKTGFYLNYAVTGKLIDKSLNNEEVPDLDRSLLTDLEISFLRLTCSDLTYKEICIELKLLPRGADRLRIDLFNKLKIHSRVGLALYAVKNGLIMY